MNPSSGHAESGNVRRDTLVLRVIRVALYLTTLAGILLVFGWCYTADQTVKLVNQGFGSATIVRRAPDWVYKQLGLQYLALSDSVAKASILISDDTLNENRLFDLAARAETAVVDIECRSLHVLNWIAETDSVEAVHIFENQETWEAIKEWSHVRSLRIYVPLEDASLCQTISILDQLTDLELQGRKIDNACLKEIVQSSSLRSLLLNDTRITDVGISELCKLSNLETLSLQGAAITDEALPVLGKLSSLQHLFVGNTMISQSALEEFIRQYPDINVVHGFDGAASALR